MIQIAGTETKRAFCPFLFRCCRKPYSENFRKNGWKSVTINNFVVKPRSVNAGPFSNMGSNDLRDGLENIVIQ